VGPKDSWGLRTHLVPDALTLTGALGVDPQVWAELVGAHTWMTPRLWQWASTHSQPNDADDKQQREKQLQGGHGDLWARGQGCMATSPSLGPTELRLPAGIHPLGLELLPWMVLPF
jgi:hypothetical protein